MSPPPAIRAADAQPRREPKGQGGPVVVTENGTPIRLSPSAWNLLEAVRSGISFEALADALSRHRGRPVSAAELEEAHRRLADGLRQAAAQESRRALPPGFWLRLPVLPASAVGHLAGRLAPLFDGRLAAVLLLAVAGILWTLTAAGSEVLHPAWDAAVLWPAYGFFLLSLLAHELGHASACVRHGVLPREIGFTVYLIYPALYSDVTAAWQLPRRQRVAVNAGGVYFQLLVAGVYAAAFLATGWAALSTALWMIVASCLFALNPVFRFDGYWMLADALGVDRPDDAPRRLLGHLAGRLRGRAVRRLPWPPKVVAVLAVYVPLAVGVWAAFLARLLPTLLDRAVTFPGHLTSAVRTLADSDATFGTACAVLHALVVSTLLLLFSGLVVWNLSGRLARLACGSVRGAPTPPTAVSGP